MDRAHHLLPSKSSRVLLLTGTPGVGKTTLIRRVVSALGDRRIQGFISDEIRVGGRREGFRLTTFDGHYAVLARTDIRSPYRVGSYGVDVEALDRIVDRCLQLDKTVDLYLIDEIGKMECFSPRFVAAVTALLDSQSRIIATISQRGGGFIQAVKNRSDVQFWEVTRENRDHLVGAVMDWIADYG